MEAAAQVAIETPATATQRTRELYKYFAPPEFTSARSKSIYPQSVLSAHVQLVSWRMNTRRALLSLIDTDRQYFVAESTKTLNLEDNIQADDPEDVIWAGCVDVEKAGRLCEHTLAAVPPPTGGPAYFEVCDLTKDSRFNTLPFVTGEPHFRYYCGVPLYTKRGIPIGSLFAIDDRIKDPAGETKISFLATMAENCMSHIEILKEKEDMKRVKHMNECLAAFVDPENRLRRKKKPETRARSNSPKRDTASTKQSSRSDLVELPTTESPKPGISRDQGDAPSIASEVTSSHRSVTGAKPTLDDDESTRIFCSAADLLCRSLSLNPGSGVIILDSGNSLGHRPHTKPSSDESSEDEELGDTKLRRLSVGTATHVSYKSWEASKRRGFNRARDDDTHSDVLAHRCFRDAEDPSHVVKPSEAIVFSRSTLERMIRSYPRGMLFNIEDEEFVASSSSENEHVSGHTYQMPATRNVIPSRSEVSVLRTHFPTARQVVFVPFWNANWSRHSVFLAYNSSPFRNFEKSPEFLHCIAFCHSITIELTRIATLASDQQKSDFIGSVSHELRSPLHGILASCEFLDDTELSSFQKSLVDTADSCARTLLDTINMVLDYSKINAFERNVRSRKGRRRNMSLSTAHLQPALNIYGDVDLAAITEEVVEGVATGQVYKDRLADVDVTDLPAEARFGDVTKDKTSESATPSIEIILDVAPRHWIFLTQPGAFRRVVMNVFGNSLKYTKVGYIRVHLHAEPTTSGAKDSDETHIITLSIKDTGQGISPQYMKTKLFTPFAQESSIAPGTGLGLSLVRSIVKMLHGEIDIQSTVGVGTEVIIKFPMTVGGVTGGTESLTSSSTPPSSGSLQRTKDDSIRIVQSKAKGHKAGYFCISSLEAKAEALKITRDTVNHYLRDWYCFDVVDRLSSKALPDIIVVAQADFTHLVSAFPKIIDEAAGPMIIVVSIGAYWKLEHNDASRQKNVEPISFPFGPYKLARIVRVCLDRLETRTQDSSTSSKRSSPTNLERDREELSEVVQAVEQIKLHGNLNVVQQGQMMANAEFAPLMVEAMSTQSSRSIEQSGGFPFPPSSSDYLGTLEIAAAVPLPKTPAPMSPDPISMAATSPAGHPPRLLLVDDNKVNLRLLNAFMQKRKYRDVHLAEDGAAAVAVYEDLIKAVPPIPPDIIFMDISMPIMNGFEAARRIRELEVSFRDSLSPLQTPPTTMIIALTGLASGRDQSEAFSSGFDLYLVKPISFKSVAKLLDSWERNGATLGLPHGSVSSEDIRGSPGDSHNSPALDS